MAENDDLPAAIAEIERQIPGAFWMLAYGCVGAEEPPYGVQILFGWEDVLAQGEGQTAAAAIHDALGKYRPSRPFPKRKADA